MIHFRTTKAIREQAAQEAARHGITISGYCEQAVRSVLETVQQDTEDTETKRDRSLPKSETVHFRVSAADKQAIVSRAKRARLSTGEYLIRAGLDDRIVVVMDGRELLHQISKIGTNINQITILAHMGRITCVDLEATNKTLKQILKTLADYIKG